MDAIDENNNYNEEPVFYCETCLSLKVMRYNDKFIPNYCGECGSANISETDIFSWEKKYEERFGVNYLKKKSGRIFKF